MSGRSFPERPPPIPTAMNSNPNPSPQPSLLARLRRSLESLRQREDQLSLVLSLVIGALVGLVVVAFILLTGRLAARMYPAGGAGWRRILVPVLGSLSTGYLLWRYFPSARGSGIPQTKFALFINDGRIQFRTVFGKFFCCSASLASGIALGREGPSVQVGAGLASVVARNLGLTTKQVKALVPAGCAAALAAAFNTPIAAVLFSLEEILGDLHAAVLGSVVLSAATSWMVLHLVLGDDPAVSRRGLPIGPSRGIRGLRGARGSGWLGIGGFREAAAGLARVVHAPAESHGLVSAGGRRSHRRIDRLLRPRGDGSRLQLRRESAERRHRSANSWCCSPC